MLSYALMPGCDFCTADQKSDVNISQTAYENKCTCSFHDIYNRNYYDIKKDKLYIEQFAVYVNIRRTGGSYGSVP